MFVENKAKVTSRVSCVK